MDQLGLLCSKGIMSHLLCLGDSGCIETLVIVIKEVLKGEHLKAALTGEIFCQGSQLSQHLELWVVLEKSLFCISTHVVLVVVKVTLEKILSCRALGIQTCSY